MATNMAHELYILRHGIAAEPDRSKYPRDADRPLTAEGKRKTAKVAKALDALGLSFDAVLSSPYLRARQTAEIVVSQLNLEARLEITNSLAPHGTAQQLVTLIHDE